MSSIDSFRKLTSLVLSNVRLELSNSIFAEGTDFGTNRVLQAYLNNIWFTHSHGAGIHDPADHTVFKLNHIMHRNQSEATEVTSSRRWRRLELECTEVRNFSPVGTFTTSHSTNLVLGREQNDRD